MTTTDTPSSAAEPTPPVDPNEVRITKRKPMSNYAKYVLSQFRERHATSVTLRQMGKNVDTIVSVAEIVKYRESVAVANLEGREPPRMPNYIGECIYKIATKLALKPCFMNYSFKEEMIDDGIENCIT